MSEQRPTLAEQMEALHAAWAKLWATLLDGLAGTWVERLAKSLFGWLP